jgi:flagellar hook protein FlgE
MGLTSALNTSLTGLAANEIGIDVIGNNIANAGTNGFKASTALFATQLSRTFSVGSAPTADDGGRNPRQVGLGTLVASIRKDFTQGSITNSTSPSDLAIQGDGFFIVDGPQGLLYTRAGNFLLNSSNELVNSQGLRVQGYTIDQNFNLITSQLNDLTVPLGDLNIAQQTQNISIGGALFPAGQAATQGALLLSEVLTDTSTAANATAASLLSNLQNAAGQPLFTVGNTVSFVIEEGGRQTQPQTLSVAAGTTLADLATLIDESIGIHSAGTIPDDPNNGPAPPGVSIVGGQLQIVGNRGTANDLTLAIGDITSNGSTVPLSFSKPFAADGESTVTDFVVFDSLGQPAVVRMTAYLESQTPTSTSYRYLLESADDSDNDVVLADGLIEFDGAGRIINGGTTSFTIDRNATAAFSPMLIDADFSQISGISSAAAGSRLSLISQDGAPPGTLASFVIDEGGVINGIFDNGLIRSLGQVVLADFRNPDGLIEAGDTAFREGPASGPALTATAGTFGVGTIRSGAIELSNTDLGRNLVDLIVASTNYRGNARVIGSVQELVDELLLLNR